MTKYFKTDDPLHLAEIKENTLRAKETEIKTSTHETYLRTKLLNNWNNIQPQIQQALVEQIIYELQKKIKRNEDLLYQSKLDPFLQHHAIKPTNRQINLKLFEDIYTVTPLELPKELDHLTSYKILAKLLKKQDPALEGNTLYLWWEWLILHKPQPNLIIHTCYKFLLENSKTIALKDLLQQAGLTIVKTHDIKSTSNLVEQQIMTLQY